MRNKLLFVLFAGCIALCGRRVLVQAAPKRVVAFDVPFLFSYGTWQDKVKVEKGRALLRGDGVTGQGGAGVNANLNLSEHAEDYENFQNAPLLAAGMNGQVWKRLDTASTLRNGLKGGLDVRPSDGCGR